MLKSLIRLSFLSRKNVPVNNFVRNLKITRIFYSEEKKDLKTKTLVPKDPFESIKDKNRNTYLEMLKIYVNRDHVYRTGHVEFIYAAMKNMEAFGVNKDLEVYKALIDVLPKGTANSHIYEIIMFYFKVNLYHQISCKLNSCTIQNNNNASSIY